ncbi:MAG: PD40 domain-containing protein [Candidatus Zixiibacteriota bacterium]|nr:MAG: PD40 domain-containing protein [candidate division Zixibacteria bacterium]
MQRLFLAKITIILIHLAVLFSVSNADTNSASHTRKGYYRQPAIHNETVVFVAEGDLWKVDASGGVAQRLTSHPGLESNPAISPDGKWLAFTGQYEGVTEAYMMPLDGGLPTRLTYFGRRANAVGWTPAGKVIVTTYHYSTLPSRQLITVDPVTIEHSLIPLSQAAEGCYDENGKTLFFTRWPFQGSYTKRYKGGTAQNIWKFTEGQPEAIPLTSDYPGQSNSPMWFGGRVYFASDRDGTMNIWSMDENGGDLKQETSHVGWDVKSPSQSKGKIAYQIGADIHTYEISSKTDRKLPIVLASDFDQLRENWIDKPFDYVTSVHLSPDGERVVITARGALFVVPGKGGRFVEATRESGIRYRGGRFMPDGKSLLALSDATGELEFWTVPADGLGKTEQITDDGTILRFNGIPSPDGKMIAYDDANQALWIHDIEGGTTTLVDSSDTWEFSGLAWSSDNRWLAYAKPSHTFLNQIFIYDVTNRESVAVTSERYIDQSPAWSADGKWLYFLSNRDVSTVVPYVWALNQPFPLIDKMTKIYMVPLTPGLRSPFEPDNELTAADEEAKDKEKDSEDSTVAVRIDFDNIQQRIMEVPAPAGNYSSLEATDKQLLWISRQTLGNRQRELQTIEIKNEDPKVEMLGAGIGGFEVSKDFKKMLVRKNNSLYIEDLPAKSSLDLSKSKVDLSGWAFSVTPAEEWRQMFIDAWRLERDYFYDPNMHGVDWEAIRDKYLPLVDRITDRYELSDLLGELVSELSALHIYVFGGEFRKGQDNIAPASLGAVLVRDEYAEGYRVEQIYRTDPDEPQYISPLLRPGVDMSKGDVITEVNGVSTLSVGAVEELLRKAAGQEVLLTVMPHDADSVRRTIVKPISWEQARDLRYRAWEYSRRRIVEEAADNEIGYVHLRATTTEDYGQWVRDFFPILDRKGLVIDMRNNNGGNIDSWILTSLLRTPWAYWQSRVGIPYPNMQLSFNGHIAVLCNEWTASDGELFCEGIRRLGLGKVFGTRTWGGEIWLSYNNRLVDRGIASAAQSGVFAPEGIWLIEGHGFEPDIEVDNLPHATFNGEDAQLQAAIEYLKQEIEKDPRELPDQPPYPDKSFKKGQ